MTMDNVNSTNLYSITVCDLNTKFNDRSHCEWSKTNLISIVSSDGIYILKPQLDIQNGPFQIELIRNPKEKFNHPAYYETGPTFDSIWQKLNSQQYMEIFLDPALLTNVEKLNLDVYPRRYRMAKWSPPIETYPRHCLLAALTVDYQLLIFSRKKNAWIIQADFSSEYDKLWTQLNQTSKDKQIGEHFEAIKNNLHSLSFCNICWKETEIGGPLLMSATIPGDIVIWQTIISHHHHHQEYPNFQEKFEVKMVLRTNLEYINSMKLFDNLLIVSTRDGQVVLYDLTINFNELMNNSTNQHLNGPNAMKTINVITIPPTVTLWHHDNIEVTDFYIQPITQDTFRIVLAKSTNICWCIINYKKKTTNEPATLGISDSFSAIDGLDPDVSLHQTPVTWLKPAGDKKAVLIANDGSFFQLEFSGNHQDTSPDFCAIKTGKVDLTHMVPYGLCSSVGGHLIAMVSCISSVYDPSKVSAPTKMLLVPTINDRRFFIDCIRKLLDEGWVHLQNIKSPMDIYDRIDYLRSVFPILEYEDSQELYKTFKLAIESIGVPKNDNQLVKLKIVTFLLRKLYEYDFVGVEKEEKNGIVKRANDLILMYNIKRTLEAIFSEPSRDNVDIQNLTIEQVISLRNYFTWLHTFFEGKLISEQYSNCYKALPTKYSRIPQETCSICNSNIEFESMEYGACTSGHKLSRCGRSLLILDLKTGTELICDYCNRHYKTKLVWPSNNMWLCSFCQ